MLVLRSVLVSGAGMFSFTRTYNARHAENAGMCEECERNSSTLFEDFIYIL
jgi:hypothetical protein